MDKVFKIFIDFDGTITNNDIGDSLFRKFGDKDIVHNVVEKLLNDELSARDAWVQLCNAVDNVDREELNNYIDSFEVDPYFNEMAKYFNDNKFEFYILSDGFDYYIDRILKREKLENIKYFANKLSITKEGKLVPEFPYYDISFFNSANCKRNHILNLTAEEDYTIFIGDGNSDKYTAVYCDFIFAKKSLLKYCEKEKITYFPFNTFEDVISRINELKNKKNLKKRHQAALKRREAYMLEE